MEETHWHSLKSTEVVLRLGTHLDFGLSSAEAKQRLEIYGKNELKKGDKNSAWKVFLNQFKNILIIVLLVATLLSALVGEIFDAALILAIVVFCAVLGFIQEYKAEKALDALKKMLSPSIMVMRDGKKQSVLSSDLVPGDILLLEAGVKIPADARLVENATLKCDEASLTGESVPVEKETEPLPADVSVSDKRNTVFTGTVVTYGRGRAVVIATGGATEFGKIAKEVSSIKSEKTPLEKRTEEIGKWLGIIALSICSIITVVSLVRQAGSGTVTLEFVIQVVMFAIALAVAAVPEALPAIVTGALAIGMHQMAKKHALIRKMPAVETLGCTTVICSDKTGTLTKGEMTVREYFVHDAVVEVTGAGYAPHGEFRWAVPANAASEKTMGLLLEAGVLCNDASLEEKEGKWLILGDPTEGALIVAAEKKGLHVNHLKRENPRIAEIPFSSERKRMTTMHRTSKGAINAFMKGAPELVLKCCAYVMDGEGVRELSEGDRESILKANERMAQNALRVLGFAFGQIENGAEFREETIERNLVFLGLAGMIDPPREEVKEAIRICREVKIKPVMITGDHMLTAIAVAREIGIFQEGDLALTGQDLDKLSSEEFENIVSRTTVYARVSPMDKIKIVKAWKNRGEVVAMTGDGVNDAPALKQADIGIAMGITGTDVAKEAADMVLNDDNFATIVSAIEKGRWIYDNIKKYLTYLLRCNITEVIVIGGVVLVLGPNFLPLLPAAILFINLVTDGLPALALGVAPPDPDIMRRPPRNPKESIFSRDIFLFLGMAVLLESPIFLYIFFHDIQDIVSARTQVFFLFIVIEMIIALNSRSIKYSVFKLKPHKWLVFAVLFQMIVTFLLLMIPAIRKTFGVAFPSLDDVFLILVIGVLIVISMEGIKFYLRRKETHSL